MVKVPANKNGLPFGSYILSNGMPGRVCGASNKNTTFVEVWGFGHDIGDCYTRDCEIITKQEFEQAVMRFGHGEVTSGIEKLRLWDKDQGN